LGRRGAGKGRRAGPLADEPGEPGATALRRWKRLRPDFAAALESAKLAGHRVKMRRRSKLTPQLADQIHRRILGGLSLHAISRLPGMPHYVTLYGWMRRDAEFARQVRLSERFRDELMADAALEIAMTATEATVDAARRQIGGIHKQLGWMAPGRPRNSALPAGEVAAD
jgi:hypothetical protein